MKVLITGACGFVGSSLATALREIDPGISMVGMDNFIRPGSETNRLKLTKLGVRILEFCKARKAGLILLSSSRVYSVSALASLPLAVRGKRFTIDESSGLPAGVSPAGIAEHFPTQAPVSLYGSTKLASETLALEYGATFSFPVWINRCGVLAGAGQMGTAEQCIFSYWVHSHARKQPLRYIGFEGLGFQLRDGFHPADLTALLWRQMNQPEKPGPRLFNAGGGADNSMSLAELTDWRHQRFGPHPVEPDPRPRPFDIPWLVMDSAQASAHFGWTPGKPLSQILEEIAVHAEQNPDWLRITASS